MNFCSHCGSAKLLHQIPEGDDRPRAVCQDCGTIHYQNPKIIVGCLPLYRGKIMLCRRNIEPRFGLWNLPSGFMENGETAEVGALRELEEEAGATADLIRLLSVYSLPHVNQVYLHFLVRLHGKWEAGKETSDIELFAPDALPWDELAFSSNQFALECYLQDVQTGNFNVHIGHLPPPNPQRKNWL